MILLLANALELLLWLCVIYYSLDIVVQCIKLALKKERPGKRFKLLLLGDAGSIIICLAVLKASYKIAEQIPIPHTKEIMIAGVIFTILKEIYKITVLLVWDIDTDE